MFAGLSPSEAGDWCRAAIEEETGSMWDFLDSSDGPEEFAAAWVNQVQEKRDAKALQKLKICFSELVASLREPDGILESFFVGPYVEMMKLFDDALKRVPFQEPS